MGMGNVASPRPSVWVRWRTYGALGLRGLTAVNIHDFRSPSPPLKRGGARKPRATIRGEPAPARTPKSGNALTRQVTREAHSRARPRGPGGAVAQGTASATRTTVNANRIFAGRSFRSPDRILRPNAFPELTGADCGERSDVLRTEQSRSARPEAEAEALTQYRIQHADTEYTHTYHIGKCVWPCHHALQPPSNAHPRARAQRSAHHSHLTPVLRRAEVPNRLTPARSP